MSKFKEKCKVKFTEDGLWQANKDLSLLQVLDLSRLTEDGELLKSSELESMLKDNNTFTVKSVTDHSLFFYGHVFDYPKRWFCIVES